MSLLRCCAVALGLSACGIAIADETSVKQTPGEIISITESNLRGHQSLYKEGWFVASATEKAFLIKTITALASSSAPCRLVLLFIRNWNNPPYELFYL